MIETIVKPQPLDNDVAVVKIIQLLGQLSLNDIEYILRLIAKVYGKVYKKDNILRYLFATARYLRYIIVRYLLDPHDIST